MARNPSSRRPSRRQDAPTPAAGSRRAPAGASRPRPRAFAQDTLRTVRGSLKRFVALATICALGVTMLVSLKIACIDLRSSADTFFDAQQLFDLRVQSTLGLTADDVEALAALEGVEEAEGSYTETVYTTVGQGAEKVDVKALTASGINEPRVVEGRLPERADEVAVTRRFLEESGLYLGDRVTFRSGSDAGADADADAGTGSGTEDFLAGVGTDGDASATDTTVFERREYTIVGAVLDPTDINAGEGTMSFRSSGTSQYAFFVTPEAAVSEAYTVVYLRVFGADEPLCYSGAYEDMVDAVKQRVDEARTSREEARGEGLRADANARIDEAEADAQEQLADGQSQLDDARSELADGAAQLADARDELASQEASAYEQLAAADAQLAQARAQLDAAEAALDANEPQVTAGLQQIADGLGTSVDGIPAALAASHDQLVSAHATLEASANMLEGVAGSAWPADAWQRLSAAGSAEEANAAAAEVNAVLEPFASRATSAIDALLALVESEEVRAAASALKDLPEPVRQAIDAAIAQAPEQVQDALRTLTELDATSAAAQLRTLRSTLSQLTELAPGMAQVVAGELVLAEAQDGYAQLTAAQAQIADGRAQVRAGREELAAGATQLSAERASALAQIAAGWDQIDASGRELADGKAQLEDAQAELDASRADAEGQIADARAQVDKIGNATWYVQDRSSLGSYASVDSDASSIETIGTVIPIVFFVVAVLISLTTMTRMVEEERGLIGLYKALGYSRRQILGKYVLYAAAACLAGGVVGNVAGFVVLPSILFTIFSTMYALPEFTLGFDAAYAFGSVALFAVGIVGATVLTCRHELAERPAHLMRPKAPKAGSRILLEHIGPLWRRMGFLNKVTARNIFRYKRRFMMTVFGIAGCTALLVTGFGIRDTVLSLPERQYGAAGVSAYDLLAVSTADDLGAAASDLAARNGVSDLQRVYLDSITVSYGGAKESVQLMVVPQGGSLAGYVGLAADDGSAIDLASEGAVITKNAEQVMGFSAGNVLELQDSTLAVGMVEVGNNGVALNYLGNMLFMTQDTYEEAFGKEFEVNAVVAHLTGAAAEQVSLAEELSGDARWLSVVSTQKLVNDFSSAFTLINTVVYVVIVLAGALSFTVVFTLSNTNISERERELATIKVLGFKRPEVHRYINKETVLLTLMGVLVGLPAGYALARSLTWILKMPSLYFDVVVDPATYAISAAMAVAFTLIVNRLTDRSLDRVDMVGALKSAE